jgi:cyclic pyranopterin phosphate synthase
MATSSSMQSIGSTVKKVFHNYLLSPYRKLLKPPHKSMWHTLERKNIIPGPWRLYVAKYFIKIRIGRFISMRTYKNKGLFLNVHLDTYSDCNRNCKFCFNYDKLPKRDSGTMSTAVFRRIIDELSEIHYCGKISPYYYGEPLLDKRLPDMISYARRKCPLAYIQANSNGDFLTEELLLRLIKAGLDEIFITNYEKVGLPKETSSEKIAEQKKRLMYLAEKYPQFVQLRRWTEINFENRTGLVIKRSNKRIDDACLRPSFMAVIDWQGNVLLCCVDYHSKYVMGNVMEDSILRIWYSQRFRAERLLLQKIGSRRKIDICVRCDADGSLFI